MITIFTNNSFSVNGGNDASAAHQAAPAARDAGNELADDFAALFAAFSSTPPPSATINLSEAQGGSNLSFAAPHAQLSVSQQSMMGLTVAVANPSGNAPHITNGATDNAKPVAPEQNLSPTIPLSTSVAAAAVETSEGFSLPSPFAMPAALRADDSVHNPIVETAKDAFLMDTPAPKLSNGETTTITDTLHTERTNIEADDLKRLFAVVKSAHRATETDVEKLREFFVQDYRVGAREERPPLPTLKSLLTLQSEQSPGVKPVEATEKASMSDFASSLASGAGEAVKAATPTNVVTSRAIINQTSASIISLIEDLQRHAAPAARTLRLQLTPENLGGIEIAITRDTEGRISARLSAEQSDTSHALDNSLGELRRSLEDAGLTVARLETSAPSSFASGNASTSHHQQPHSSSPSDAEKNVTADSLDAEIEPESNESHRLLTLRA